MRPLTVCCVFFDNFWRITELGWLSATGTTACAKLMLPAPKPGLRRAAGPLNAGGVLELGGLILNTV
jgi:hypothetical protein